jgi:hypothetical protein
MSKIKKPCGPPELVKKKAILLQTLCGSQAVKAMGKKYTEPESASKNSAAMDTMGLIPVLKAKATRIYETTQRRRDRNKVHAQRI